MVTAKTYLQQIEVLNLKIDHKIKQLEDLKLMSRTTKSLDYSADRVQTSPDDKMSSMIGKYIDLEREINGDIDEFVSLKNKVINEIHSLSNPTFIQILFKRYVEMKSLRRVARETGYEYKYACKLHGEALICFYEEVIAKHHDQSRL